MSISGRFKCERGDFHMDLKFQFPGQGITGIFGPSGCGKTTLLRALAGLDHHADGALQMNEQTWQDSGTFLQPHLRPIGYVFQEASLFDHLSVMANLEYGWKRSAESRTDALQQAIELLDLKNLLERQPGTLSGGERQRVAIGRALAANPRLLLMDEPLASLDQQRRADLLPYLEYLPRELGLPMVYVSHDLEEISRLADHLVLMKAGRIIASDRCGHLLTRMDLPMAQSTGAVSAFDAEVESIDKEYALTTFRCDGIQFTLPGIMLQTGILARLIIAARDVSLARVRPERSSILNIIEAEIDSIHKADHGRVTVRLKIGNLALLSTITRKSADHLELAVGSRVFAQVKSIAVAGPAYSG